MPRDKVKTPELPLSIKCVLEKIISELNAHTTEYQDYLELYHEDVREINDILKQYGVCDQLAAYD